MDTSRKHEEMVDACIKRLSQDLPPEKLGQVFGQLVGALWLRSSRTLSDVTLDAIFERALHISRQRFPILASFKLDHSELRTKGFHSPAESAGGSQLIEAFRYFLVTILTLIGNLTADILLTVLYQELQTFLVQPLAAATSILGPAAKRPKEQGLPDLSGRPFKGQKSMKDVDSSHDRVLTHIANLDEILGGGLPKGSMTIIAGPPGAGKTILSQQICFQNASSDQRVVFFQTLSEPTAKTLRYVKQFKFFDSTKLSDGAVEFIDLGGVLRTNGIQEGIDLLMEQVKRVNPAFVVIDSFKVFEDLAKSREELRKFSYEVAIKLMAWECTTLLLGEFNTDDMETNPLFSIVDGLIKLKLRREAGDDQRFIQVVKMRGTDHSRDDHSLAIGPNGVSVYAPRVTIRREQEAARIGSGSVSGSVSGSGSGSGSGPQRIKLGISKLDELLGEGVPVGSSFIISGVAGTGKTLLSLEFIYRGAKEYGEKGVYFSFEETEDRLRAEARGMGWDMDELIDSGMIEIVFIAQPDIVVEKHLLMMNDRIQRMKAKRIAIDSVSLFVHKLGDAQIVREKIFQLATLVQRAQGVGFFATDIPYGSNRLSRFGVEETVVDGVILLTASEKAYGRERFIEIYKLRNTAHLDGRHIMKITSDGIFITPREKMILHHERHKEKKASKKAA